jgi:hypothetical protein
MSVDISQMVDEIYRPSGRLGLIRVVGKHGKRLDGTEITGFGRQAVESRAVSPLHGRRARMSPVGAICGLATIGGVQHRVADRG